MNTTKYTGCVREGSKEEIFRGHFGFTPEPNTVTREHDEAIIEQRLVGLWDLWIINLKSFGNDIADLVKYLEIMGPAPATTIEQHRRHHYFVAATSEKYRLDQFLEACASAAENGYCVPKRFEGLVRKVASTTAR